MSQSVAKALNGLQSALSNEEGKKDEEKEGGKEQKKEQDSNRDSVPVEHKDFFWDQFLKYISSAILALTLLSTLEFFRDGGVACFHPPDTASLIPTGVDALTVYKFASDQAAFINKYCISSIPFTEFFPVYILIHGLLLVIPHYIWSTIFKGDFDSFFSIVRKIDRFRTGSTGEYREENFDRVKKLEREYGGTNKSIFNSYVLKLLIQFMVCAGSIVVSASWLTDFSFSFDCPRVLVEDGIIPGEWPLNVTVPCVYTTLRIMRLIRIVDFILTGLAAALIVYGVTWCFIRHAQQLGYRQISKFTFQSGLTPEIYFPPPILHLKENKFYGIIKKNNANCCVKWLLWLVTRERLLDVVNIRSCFFPRIANDLDLFLLFLFKADASHGKVFKDIQVQNELKQLLDRDHRLLHLYINIQQDMYKDQNLNDLLAEDELFSPPLPSPPPTRWKRVQICLRYCCCCCCFWRPWRRVDKSYVDPSETTYESVNQPLTVMSNINEEPRRTGVRRRRRHTSVSNDVLDQLEKVGEEETPWFLECLVRCCEGSFTRKKEDGTTRRRTKDVTPSEKQPTLRDLIAEGLTNFHRIFWESGSNMDPERMMFYFFKPHTGNLKFNKDDLRGVRDLIYYFVQKHGKNVFDVPSNNIAMDIAFGTIGYGSIIARPFRKVYALNFHPFFRNTEKVVKVTEDYTNVISLLYPDDIYTYNDVKITEANTELMKKRLVRDMETLLMTDKMKKRLAMDKKQKVSLDMLVVGPLFKEDHQISVHLLLNSLYAEGYIGKDALLLTIRPLKVGPRKIHCHKFEPSKQLFRNDPVKPDDHRFVHVDGEKGIEIICEGVPCVFEFIPYKFCGKDNYLKKAPVDTSRVVDVSHDPQGGITTSVREVTSGVGGVTAAMDRVAAAMGGVAAAVGGVAAAMGEAKKPEATGNVGRVMTVVSGVVPVEPVPQNGAHQDRISGDNVTTNQTSMEASPDIRRSGDLTVFAEVTETNK